MDDNRAIVKKRRASQDSDDTTQSVTAVVHVPTPNTLLTKPNHSTYSSSSHESLPSLTSATGGTIPSSTSAASTYYENTSRTVRIETPRGLLSTDTSMETDHRLSSSSNTPNNVYLSSHVYPPSSGPAAERFLSSSSSTNSTNHYPSSSPSTAYGPTNDILSPRNNSGTVQPPILPSSNPYNSSHSIHYPSPSSVASSTSTTGGIIVSSSAVSSSSSNPSSVILSSSSHNSSTVPLSVLQQSHPNLTIRRPHMPHAPSIELSGKFDDDYLLQEQIGRGTFSIVRKCVSKHNGAVRAVKIIDTKRFRRSTSYKGSSSLLDEVKILRGLNHPGIIEVYEAYEGLYEKQEALYLVTEFAKGGELFDSILSAGNFSENQARYVVWQALEALAYLHDKGIVHRDLKPENLLVFDTDYVPIMDPYVRPGYVYPHSTEEITAMKTNNNIASYVPMLRIKVADFGVARYVGAAAYASGASTFVGSPQYVAPEVLFARDANTMNTPQNGTNNNTPVVSTPVISSYGRAVDVYSLGVILYVMLAGYLPFDDGAPLPPEVAAVITALQNNPNGNVSIPPNVRIPPATWEERVKAGIFYFAPPVWTHISEIAKDCIKAMMNPDPRLRVTVAQAMDHPWFLPIRQALGYVPVNVPPVPLPLSIPTSNASLLPHNSMNHSSNNGKGLTPLAQAARNAAYVTAEAAAEFDRTNSLPDIGSLHMGNSPQRGRYSASYRTPNTAAINGGNMNGTMNHHDHHMDMNSTQPNAINLLNGNDPLDELLNASNGANFSTVTDTTLGTSVSAQARQAHELKVLQTVAKSLDFTRLLMIQRSLAATYRSAYLAVRHLPTSAMEVRKHAVAMRDLQNRVRTVMQRCRNLSQSILVILPDLRASVLEGDVSLTQAIFSRMRQWVSELRTEAQSMQEQHSALILDVQMSLERAQALAALDHGHVTAWNERNMLENPDTGRSDDSSNSDNNNNMRQDSFGNEIDGVTPISLMASPVSSFDGTTTDTNSASVIRRGGSTVNMGSPVNLYGGTNNSSNDPVDDGKNAMNTDEGDEFLQLFLDPATVVTNGKKLKRILTSMGENMDGLAVYGSNSKHTLSSNPTGNHPSHGTIPVNGKTTTPNANGSFPNSPLRDEDNNNHNHDIYRSMSPTHSLSTSNVSTPNIHTTNNTSIVRGINGTTTNIGRLIPDLHNHGPLPPHGTGGGTNNPVALMNDPSSSSTEIVPQDISPSTSTSSSMGHRSGACLACALQDLRQVDVILSKAVDFWASMELVIDVVVRRKEHSETLLAYSSSSRMMNKAITSLSEYQAFWQAFTYLCGRYEDSLSAETRNMYSWLSSPLSEIDGSVNDPRLMVTMGSFSPVNTNMRTNAGVTPLHGSGTNEGAIVPLPMTKAIMNGPNPYTSSTNGYLDGPSSSSSSTVTMNTIHRPPLSSSSSTVSILSPSTTSSVTNGIMSSSTSNNNRSTNSSSSSSSSSSHGR